MEIIITGKELYDRFNIVTSYTARALLYDELPAMYRDAWEDLAEYSVKKVISFIKRRSQEDAQEKKS